MNIDFWAQSLDNTSDDDMATNGEMLPAQEVGRRQALVERITQVAKNQENLFTNGNVRATFADPSFVLRVTPLNQRDVKDRRAPIVCHSIVPNESDPSWPSSVLDLFTSFSTSIGRPISEQDKNSIISVLTELSHYKIQKKNPLLLVTGAVLVLILSILVIYSLRVTHNTEAIKPKTSSPQKTQPLEKTPQ